MNEHPFTSPLSELTIEELDKKYSDLINRWQIAKRMKMNQNIAYQLDLLLDSILYEKQRRATIDDQTSGVILDTDPIKDIITPFKPTR